MANPLSRQFSFSSSSTQRAMGRRASDSSTNSDIFSDSHAIHELPAERSRASTPPLIPDIPSLPSSQQPSRRSSRRSAAGVAISMGDYSNDLAKRRRLSGNPTQSRNSFTLRHDGPPRGPLRMPSSASGSIASEMIQRPSSVVSSVIIPQPQSPYVGASGPSHPYAMYPQGISNRQSMVSTIREPMTRDYLGPSGPSHPYGMYNQDTALEAEMSPLMHSTDIASVGFPGLGRSYARRLGPDGEDADDLIGPDGHIEQLPAYTRYQDAGPIPTKGRLGTTSSSSETLTPEQEPMIVVEGPDGERLVRTQSGPDSSASTARGDDNESGRTKDGLIKRTRKKRMCCGVVPCWVVLIFVVVVILSAIMGGVVGRVLAHHGPLPHGLQVDTTATATDSGYATVTYTTTLVDASPINKPSGLPPLPTGTFLLPMKPPSVSSNGCLSNISEINAWQCYSQKSFLQVVVTGDLWSAALPKISLSTHGGTPKGIAYGPQPPVFRGAVDMQIVVDLSYPDRGPASFFYTVFDKLVVLHESELNLTSATTASLAGRNPRLRKRNRGSRSKAFVQPAEKVWMCHWNYTVMEGFIYMNQDYQSTEGANTGGTPTSPDPGSISVIVTSVTVSGTVSVETISVSVPGPQITVVSTEVGLTLTTPAIPPTASSNRSPSAAPKIVPGSSVPGSISPVTRPVVQATPPPSPKLTPTALPTNSIPPLKLLTTAIIKNVVPLASVKTVSKSTLRSASITTTLHKREPQATPDTANVLPPIYPKVVKLEERRIRENEAANAPYCVQMQMLDNGHLGPVAGPDGKPIRVLLAETEGHDTGPDDGLGPGHKRRASWDDFLVEDVEGRDLNVEGGCKCEWLSS